MYSRSVRYDPIGKRDLQVPKNYSGNAFNTDPQKNEKDADEAEKLIAHEPQKECEECEVCESAAKGNSLFSGFSFEDILLIALIMILSQNGGGDDILIMLALLLAYKK